LSSPVETHRQTQKEGWEDDPSLASKAGPGNAFVCAPGHDAWVVGDEPCVALHLSGMGDYAK
jgi:hypothetical protein